MHIATATIDHHWVPAAVALIEVFDHSITTRDYVRCKPPYRHVSSSWPTLLFPTRHQYRLKRFRAVCFMRVLRIQSSIHLFTCKNFCHFDWKENWLLHQPSIFGGRNNFDLPWLKWICKIELKNKRRFRNLLEDQSTGVFTLNSK